MKKIKEFKQSFFGIIWTVWRILKIFFPGNKKVILAFLGISLFLSVIPFVFSGSEALLINELIKNGEQGISEKILWLLLLIIGAALLQKILSSLRIFVNKHLWMNMNEFFELIILKKRSEIDIATYENPKFQDLINRVNERGNWAFCNLFENQFQQITNLTQMIGVIAILFYFDWRFFVLVVLSVAPDFIVQLKYGKSSWDIWDEDSQTRRKYSSIRSHFFGTSRIMELKVFQNVEKLYGMVVEMLRNFNSKQRKLEANALKWRIFSQISSMVFQAMIYIWIIWLVSNGFVKIGTMTFLLSSFKSFESALGGFFSNIAYQFEWSLYTNDMFKVLDTEPFIKSDQNIITINTETSPLIEFKDVSFAYPNSEKLILKNINLTIHPNERLAIVGLNGAGKSTLIKLLMRFYDPTGGVILINGIDLKLINIESWWSIIASLFQNYSEYNFSVRDSIALGRSNGNGQLFKVVRCAKESDAHEFIVNLKHRYNQMIGKEFDEGINLSGGQSQKIALARSLYRSPLLLILDEPTSSIDANAEANIFAKLESNHCSQIIISHRFSTVRRANKICVLENGEISEFGTHEALIRNPKSYAKLFNLQAEGYK